MAGGTDDVPGLSAEDLELLEPVSEGPRVGGRLLQARCWLAPCSALAAPCTHPGGSQPASLRPWRRSTQTSTPSSATSTPCTLETAWGRAQVS